MSGPGSDRVDSSSSSDDYDSDAPAFVKSCRAESNLLQQQFSLAKAKLKNSSKARELFQQRKCKVAFMCLVPIVVGVLVLTLTEEWTILTSLYVITQIMTTIGYGDVGISHPLTRLFMTVYVLWCLVLVAYGLAFYVTSFLDQTEDRMRERLGQFVSWSAQQTKTDLSLRWAPMNELLSAGAIFGLHVLFGVLYFGYVDRTPSDCELNSEGECTDGCIIGLNECHPERHSPMNFQDALYMSVITLTTVGFGDFSPKSRTGRAVGIVWMCSGVLATGNFIAAVQKCIFDSLGTESQVSINGTDVEGEDFEAMDAIHGHGDGKVTRGEFKAYMIKKYKLVPDDVLDHIDDVYSVLQELSKIRLDDQDAKNQVTFEDMLTLRSHNRKLSTDSPEDKEDE